MTWTTSSLMLSFYSWPSSIRQLRNSPLNPCFSDMFICWRKYVLTSFMFIWRLKYKVCLAVVFEQEIMYGVLEKMVCLFVSKFYDSLSSEEDILSIAHLHSWRNPNMGDFCDTLWSLQDIRVSIRSFTNSLTDTLI